MSTQKLNINDDKEIYMDSQLVSATDTHVWPLKCLPFAVEAGKSSLSFRYEFQAGDKKKKRDDKYWGYVELTENSDKINLHYYVDGNKSCDGNIVFSIIGNEGKELVKYVQDIKLSYYGNSIDIKDFINKSTYNILSKKLNYFLLHQLKIVEYHNSLRLPNKQVISTTDEIKITQDFGKLLQEQQFSDITLKSNDNKEFKAHKAILAFQSDVFSKMFVHDMKEKNEGIIKISDITGDVLEELLKFMYTGKLSKIKDRACEMLLIAEKYNINGLKMLCSEEIKRNLTSDNAIATLSLVDKISNCEDLVSAVIEFMVMQGSELLKTAEFEALKESHPHLREKVIKTMIEYY